MQVFLKKSSINETYYIDFPSDGTNIGPNTSLCTNYKIHFSLRVSFSSIIFTPASSTFLIEIKFMANLLSSQHTLKNISAKLYFLGTTYCLIRTNVVYAYLCFLQFLLDSLKVSLNMSKPSKIKGSNI
jgi:hypothetical protein